MSRSRSLTSRFSIRRALAVSLALGLAGAPLAAQTLQPSGPGISAPAPTRFHPITAQQLALLEQLEQYLSFETLPDGMGGNVPTLRLTGANFQIVDGSGSTDGTPNGLGNLIVGYNELGNPNGDDRTGSHNIAFGQANSYSSYGGLVGPLEATVSAPFASVSGGRGNIAMASYSSVTGGLGNTANGTFASVAAGALNTAMGTAASVSGGTDNLASASYASVSGGASNRAAGLLSSVSGGLSNTASYDFTSVSGGTVNVASEAFASISGGSRGVASGLGASISGGRDGQAIGFYSSVTGGNSNRADGNDSTVSGGHSRSATGGADWVAGTLFEDS